MLTAPQSTASWLLDDSSYESVEELDTCDLTSYEAFNEETPVFLIRRAYRNLSIQKEPTEPFSVEVVKKRCAQLRREAESLAAVKNAAATAIENFYEENEYSAQLADKLFLAEVEKEIQRRLGTVLSNFLLD